MDKVSVDWRGGIVINWGMDAVDISSSIEKQIDQLREDLAQVEYPGDIVLDVGWLPEGDVNGRFVVMVVQKENWDEPLDRKECRELAKIISVIEECVNVSLAAAGPIIVGKA